VKEVEPKVRLIARPDLDWNEIDAYLKEVDGTEWLDQRYIAPDLTSDSGPTLVEIAGRMCYRSWKPGLNPNVTKVRSDQDDYLTNILRSAHGSVLEHANYTFILQDVSRVCTHEWVRHRAGTAISQESLRYVRLTDIPFWIPTWARANSALVERIHAVVSDLEELQRWMADELNIDEPGVPFHVKKAFTSFMRRLAPEGVGTTLVWTANIRALRHVIATRTEEGAEEEIRNVAGQLGVIMRRECPQLFSDFAVSDTGVWTPKWRKV
jgi:thymidylate synthase (FAD)